MHSQCLSFPIAQQKSQLPSPSVERPTQVLLALHQNFLMLSCENSCCSCENDEPRVSQMRLKHHAACSQLEFSWQRSQQVLSALWVALWVLPLHQPQQKTKKIQRKWLEKVMALQSYALLAQKVKLTQRSLMVSESWDHHFHKSDFYKITCLMQKLRLLLQ